MIPESQSLVEVNSKVFERFFTCKNILCKIVVKSDFINALSEKCWKKKFDFLFINIKKHAVQKYTSN